MTGVVLVSIYLVALTLFLGLDIIAKVPPTLYGLVLAGLGAVAAVSLVGGLHLSAAEGLPRTLGTAALFVGAAAAGGGLVAIGRLLGAFSRRSR